VPFPVRPFDPFVDPPVELIDRLAAGAHAQEGEDGVDEAGEGADRQLQADARSDAHMFEIGFADVLRVSGKGIAGH